MSSSTIGCLHSFRSPQHFLLLKIAFGVRPNRSAIILSNAVQDISPVSTNLSYSNVSMMTSRSVQSGALKFPPHFFDFCDNNFFIRFRPG